jgi:hypothetical protein
VIDIKTYFQQMDRGSPLAPLLQYPLLSKKKITDVVANNLMVPYPGKVKPAWRPALSTSSNKPILVCNLIDVGVVGVMGGKVTLFLVEN